MQPQTLRSGFRSRGGLVPRVGLYSVVGLYPGVGSYSGVLRVGLYIVRGGLILSSGFIPRGGLTLRSAQGWLIYSQGWAYTLELSCAQGRLVRMGSYSGWKKWPASPAHPEWVAGSPLATASLR